MLVPLSLGYGTEIDEADWPLVRDYSWKAAETKPGSGRVYAIAFPFAHGRQRTVYMHRLIMGVSEHRQKVDHIDLDTLNNRRSNLRVCTNGQNMANSRRNKGNTSGFKGVSWSAWVSRWKAEISVNGRHVFLGRFKDKAAAARAYDAAAVQHFGEFARVNFPAEGARSAWFD